MPGHSHTGDVINAADRFRRRAIRLAPSADPFADAVAETVMRHWPDAPDCVVEAFSAFASKYAEQTGKTVPEQMDWDWLWQHFARLSRMVSSEPEGAA